MQKLVVVECHESAAFHVAEAIRNIGYCAVVKDACHDSVVERNREMLLQRSNVGVLKYGVTIADNPLTLKQWVNHALEEALDMANYLQKIKMELENGNGSSETRTQV